MTGSLTSARDKWLKRVDIVRLTMHAGYDRPKNGGLCYNLNDEESGQHSEEELVAIVHRVHPLH